MKTFIGLTVLMGVIQKPTIHSYWSTEPMMCTKYFSQCMSRDRYESILKYLRFSDPYEVDPKVKNTRIRMFFEQIHMIISSYSPAQNLSLDECLVLYKAGRLMFKIFIRSKRVRFGMKLFQKL